MYKKNKNNWRYLGSVLNKTLIYISIPLVLFLVVFPEQIIKLIYFNKDFSESIEILRLFGFLIVIRFFTDTSALMLTTSNRQDKRTKVVLFAIILSIPLYYLMIKKYGVEGAIYTSLITNGFAGLSYVLIAIKDVKRWFFIKEILGTFAVSAVIFVVLWYFRFNSFFISMPLAAITLVLWSYFFGYNKDERKLLHPKSSFIGKVTKKRTKFG